MSLDGTGYGLTKYLARPMGGELTEPGDPDDPMTMWNRMFSTVTGDKPPSLTEKDAKLERDGDTFFRSLVMDLEIVRANCSQQKTLRNLNARFDANDAAAANKKRIRLKKDNTIDKEWLDGYASMGFGLGLEALAINTSSGYFANKTYELTPNSFVLRSVDRTRGRTRLAKALTRWLEFYIKQANAEREDRDAFYSVSKNGTALQVMRMIMELQYLNDGTGKITETRKKPRMWVKNHPVRDFLVTNIHRPYCEDQEGFFLFDRATSVYRLEGCEATFDYETDPHGIPISFKRTGGEYFNLNQLRAVLPMGKNGIFSAGVSSNGSTDTTDQRPYQATSNVALFDVARWEGSISSEVWKNFTPQLGMLFGIDVDLEEVPKPEDGATPEEFEAYNQFLKEYRARLTRYKHWVVSYVSPGGPTPVPYACVIGFEPSQTNQNCAYSYVYSREEHEFYGNGICDLGGPLARVRDALMNAYVRLSVYNSDPSFLVDESILKHPDMEEVRKLLVPGNPIQKKANRPGSLNTLLEVLQFKEPVSLDRLIMLAEAAFFDVTGVLPAIQGRANANTAAQDSMNQQNAQNRLDEMLVPMQQERFRMYADFMRFAWVAMGREEFLKDVEEKAGDDALYIHKEVNDIDDISRMFYFEHPLGNGRNQRQTVVDLTALTPLAMTSQDIDTRKWWETLLAFIYPHYEDMMAPGGDIPPPEEEEFMMLRGDWVTPDKTMLQQDPTGTEFSDHLTAHMALAEELQQGMTTVVIGDERMDLDETEAIELWQRLRYYIQRANKQLQVFQMMQMMMGAGQPGQPGQDGAGGSQPKGISQSPKDSGGNGRMSGSPMNSRNGSQMGQRPHEMQSGVAA